ITATPRARSASAMARPIPRLDPVTRTVGMAPLLAGQGQAGKGGDLPRPTQSLRGAHSVFTRNRHGRTPSLAAFVDLEMGAGDAGLDPAPGHRRWHGPGSAAGAAVVAGRPGQRESGL